MAEYSRQDRMPESFQVDDYTLMEPPEPIESRPWSHLATIPDVEAWIDEHNRKLQRYASRADTGGQGICFGLEHGGEIYMHTNQDGDIVLDITPEAEWIAPLITAATRVPAPSARLWSLPGDSLTQLIFGLSSVIATSRTVLNHSFRSSRYR
jgi:hypothetical protein